MIKDIHKVDEKFIKLETFIANCERNIEILNQEVIRHSKIIDFLVEKNKELSHLLHERTIVSFSQEVRPPHY